MDPADREKLIAKKTLLNTKLSVHRFMEQHLLPWLEIYDYLRNNQIAHEVKYLASVSAEEIPAWKTRFGTGILEPYHFNEDQLIVSDTEPLHAAIAAKYPNIHPLRYVPDLPVCFSDEEDAVKVLQALEKKFSLSGQVLFFHQHLSPVLLVPFSALAENVNNLLLQFENIFIIPENHEWLLFRSMEDEWRFGKQNTK